VGDRVPEELRRGDAGLNGGGMGQPLTMERCRQLYLLLRS
jgi:hypothetical protein